MGRCVVQAVAISLAAALPPLASAQFTITLSGLVRLTPDEVAPPLGHLLRTPIVRKGLNITDDQAEKLKTLQKEEAKKYDKEFAALDKESLALFDRQRYEAEVEKLEEKLEEKLAEVDARRDQVEERLQAGLAPTLLAVLEPAQRRRLDQIRLRLLGLHAWEDCGVRKALGLTEAQRTAIARVLARAHARVPEQACEIIRATEREAGLDLHKWPKVRDEKAAALYQGYAEEIQSRLTDAQKKKWQELVGPPIPLEYRLDIVAIRRDHLQR